MSPLLGLCLCLSLQGAPAPPDRWFAEDKVKHFLASFVATSLGASAARLGGLEPRESAWAGAAVGGAFGVWKELRDRGREGSTASARDLVWDAAGVAAGVAVQRQIR